MLRKTKLGNQSGISLIEILITTLILGIGLLGVAALQVSGVSGNQEAFYMSQATTIADELASKIRSSKVTTIIDKDDAKYIAFADYADAYTTDSNPVKCPKKSETPPSDCANTKMCTLAELAAIELKEACWVAKNTLPLGEDESQAATVRVVTQDAGNLALTVVIDWASAAKRDDLGQKDHVNTNCNDVTGSASRNCVMVEIMP